MAIQVLEADATALAGGAKHALPWTLELHHQLLGRRSQGIALLALEPLGPHPGAALQGQGLQRQAAQQQHQSGCRCQRQHETAMAAGARESPGVAAAGA